MKMKKWLQIGFVAVMLGSAGLFLTGCDDSDSDNVEQELEKLGQEINREAEKLEKELDSL